MASEGPNSAGTGADDSAVGTRAWGNPENVTASDDTFTTVSIGTDGVTVKTSHYLKATNFGFSIPGGSTIDGILVEIERKKFDPGEPDSFIVDDRVRIVRADGSIGSTDKADTGTHWPTGDAYASYGGSSDLWGESWAVADINDADFGVVLSVTLNDPNDNQGLRAQVDHVRITVTYTDSGQTISVSSVASSEAFGADKINLNCSPSGITSAEALGSPTVQPGAVAVSLDAIASAEAFGFAQVNINCNPSGIATAEAFGSPTVQPGAVTITLTGIASAENVSNPQMNLSISANSIASAEASGLAELLRLYLIQTSGIASAENFGSPQLNLRVSANPIASGEVFGNPTVLPGAVTITVTGIASAENLSSPKVNLSISPNAAASGEAFGVARINLQIVPVGIASAQAFGATQVNLKIEPSGIASAQALGSPQLNLRVSANPIASLEAFGSVALSGRIPSAIFRAKTFSRVLTAHEREQFEAKSQTRTLIGRNQ